MLCQIVAVHKGVVHDELAYTVPQGDLKPSANMLTAYMVPLKYAKQHLTSDCIARRCTD